MCATPTIIHPNRYFQRLCLAHLKDYERTRTRAKARRILPGRNHPYTRLECCLAALAHPAPGAYSEMIRLQGTKAAAHWLHNMYLAKRYWQRLVAEHPEKLPPGFDNAVLPPNAMAPTYPTGERAARNARRAAHAAQHFA